ncbi:MAG TPA: YjjG family noncanonical pyrimidine nucleotidase [Bacteroidia bacterium]|jgi:putative hydrolase of the HAD superfamily|nr:YjjG family noncanonical pyrimidine nucleotidase [Bacteroidia bacterium]
MSTPAFRHLFFDLDRTLWDMEKNARETLAELYFKYSLDERGIQSANEFIFHYNQYNDVLWDRYRRRLIDKATLRALRFKQTLAHFDIHDKKLATIFDEEYISEAPKKKNLVEGTIEVLTELKPEFQLHIITNGFHETQLHKIRNSGLEEFFAEIISSEGSGHMKPDKKIFDHALKKTKANKEESLMIGDDLVVDIAGAREAGWKQVFYNPGGAEHDEEVTYEIRDLKELLRIVK